MMQGGMSAVADQTVRRWFWPRTGLLTALRNQLPAWQDDIHLQINVSGHGLQHCSSISVSDGTNVMQATVVHKSSSGAALPARKTLTEMAVDVAIPWSVMQNLYGHLASTGELSLTLTAQSDFYVISLPVTLRSDVQALQDRVESMLSVCKTLSALVIRRALCNAAILHAFKFVE